MGGSADHTAVLIKVFNTKCLFVALSWNITPYSWVHFIDLLWFGATSSTDQGFLLPLCSGITPDNACEVIYSAEVWTMLAACRQVPALVPWVSFRKAKIQLFDDIKS